MTTVHSRSNNVVQSLAKIQYSNDKADLQTSDPVKNTLLFK